MLSGGTVLVCLALRSIRYFFGTRGFIHRVAEIIPFGWPALVSIALILRVGHGPSIRPQVQRLQKVVKFDGLRQKAVEPGIDSLFSVGFLPVARQGDDSRARELRVLS